MTRRRRTGASDRARHIAFAKQWLDTFVRGTKSYPEMCGSASVVIEALLRDAGQDVGEQRTAIDKRFGGRRVNEKRGLEGL